MRTIGTVSLLVLAGAGAMQAWAANGPVDQTFAVKKVHIDGLVAQVTFDNAAGDGVRVQATGKAEVIKRFDARSIGDEVVLRLTSAPGANAWFPWNLFNEWSEQHNYADLQVRISAPLGTPVEIDGMIGRVTGGDLDAPLQLEGAALDAKFGRVTTARISVAGAGKIQVGQVRDTLDIEVAGSGTIEAASAAKARVDIAGGGDVRIGPLAQGLDADIAGSGDVRVTQVNGPVEVSIAGSGNVRIDGGRATPFRVDIAGSGDVVFKGEAVNPKVSIYGSGDVKVDSYSGQLDQDIGGSGSFKVVAPVAPAPPAPPSPPQAPAAPASKF